MRSVLTKNRLLVPNESKNVYRPGRKVGFFFAFLAVLFVIMAATSTWTPTLGLDLRGGTTITLTASQEGSDTISTQTLEQARHIIQQRVDGMGVGETAISIQGNRHIVVSAPGTNQDALVSQVGQTAQLAFRRVYDAAYTQGTSSTQTQGPVLPTQPPAEPTQTPSADPSSAGDGTTSTDDKAPLLSLDEIMAWEPSEADRAAFAKFECGDQVDTSANQVLFACDKNGAEKLLLGPVAITGTHVTDATATMPQNDLSYVVNLQFDGTGTEAFSKLTAQAFSYPAGTPQNRFAIVVDNVIISAPTVRAAIDGGVATISGSFNHESATALANVLKYGALPISFEVSSVDNISPTLGGNQLTAGLWACAVGLFLVAAYCLFYYRGLGLVVLGSLIVAGALTYAFMCLLGPAMGFALSLPGLAGAVLSIGTTADSFIIYFERIRDEIREGRPLRSAIEQGWRDARSTIVIADMVSLLSATVLFILAVGSVKGFAFMLGLTTVMDLLIVFFFTHPLVSLLGRTEFFGKGHKMSGLSAEHMGVSRSSLLGVRERGANVIKRAAANRKAQV